MTKTPNLPRDGSGRLIWDWICPICHVEWTSGDARCPRRARHGQDTRNDEAS